MQDRLIQRYLGNKSAISPKIVSVIKSIAEPGDLIFDAFSGTLSVSAALRSAGFQVACNDINHFSWVFSMAYFSSSQLPWPEGVAGFSRTDKASAWRDAIGELTCPYTPTIPAEHRRTDIFDHYCENGSKSKFLSSRGRSGRRRFFSPENAVMIDRALSRIRYWYRKGDLGEQTRCILTASLLSAIEKRSNTQGTFHDFPRDFIDPRALQPLSVKPPISALFFAPVSEIIGKAQDTLEFVHQVPEHRVIYIDPPYNFRQYTSYYFMLNLISSYPEVDDLNVYFNNIQFVRGQNMETDFKSTFCGKNSFLSSLELLIDRSKSDYVVLSYFDGRNHWGEFKSDVSDHTGRDLLEAFFDGPRFVNGSFECTLVERLNYQSYGGYSARSVNEFLFVAQKRKLPAVSTEAESISWSGKATKTRIAS